MFSTYLRVAIKVCVVVFLATNVACPPRTDTSNPGTSTNQDAELIHYSATLDEYQTYMSQRGIPENARPDGAFIESSEDGEFIRPVLVFRSRRKYEAYKKLTYKKEMRRCLRDLGSQFTINTGDNIQPEMRILQTNPNDMARRAVANLTWEDDNLTVYSKMFYTLFRGHLGFGTIRPVDTFCNEEFPDIDIVVCRSSIDSLLKENLESDDYLTNAFYYLNEEMVINKNNEIGYGYFKEIRDKIIVDLSNEQGTMRIGHPAQFCKTFLDGVVAHLVQDIGNL